MTTVSIAKGGVIRLENGKFGCHPGKVQANASIKSRILALIKENGPMSAREIAQELKLDTPNRVPAALQGSKEYHIYSYRRDEDGGRLYPRALYAYGPGRDAPKPKPLTKVDYNKRSKLKMKRTVTSVWDLGIPSRERRQHAMSRVRGMDKSPTDIVEAG
jgi:hypothetical protein